MGRWGTAVEKTGGGLFMELQPGKNRIRVLSDPVVENKTFDTGPSTIFSWIVWDYATSQVRVLSKGPSFLRKFDFFTEAWGEEIPMKCDIIIEKTGAGMGTRYEFVAVPIQEQLPSSWQSDLAKIDFHKLKPNAIPVNEWDTSNRQPAAEAEPEPVQDTVVDDVPDGPINLDDIPF